MYDLFSFIGNYIKYHENQTYGDLKSKLNDDKIKSMLNPEEYDVYNQIKNSDRQRLLKYQ